VYSYTEAPPFFAGSPFSLDKDKNIANNPGDGVAITVYKYDEQGRRIETLQYDKNEVLVEKKG
jgi:hypothetical protein